MRSGPSRRFGDLELQILNVLWDRGPSTVREVLEALPVKPRPAYTTVLTMMRLMHEKDYLDRRQRGRAHIYQAKLREGPTKRSLLRQLVGTAFRGSAEAAMVGLLQDEALSERELARIRRLIDEKERGG
jgi:predicted transcriptional regulator